MFEPETKRYEIYVAENEPNASYEKNLSETKRYKLQVAEMKQHKISAVWIHRDGTVEQF